MPNQHCRALHTIPPPSAPRGLSTARLVLAAVLSAGAATIALTAAAQADPAERSIARRCRAGHATDCWRLARRLEEADCRRAGDLYLRAWRLDPTLDMSRLLFACVERGQLEAVCARGSITACGAVGWQSLGVARTRPQQRSALTQMVGACRGGAASICEILDPVLTNFIDRYPWYFGGRLRR
ncbi:MAG: hypothetical protein JWM10_5052 [Myxococcaceae bacterium]|nr:hypothetical protein [Myxococcaceae bacterium]